MGPKYPPVELECLGCGHRWSTTAKAGASIRCPECIKRGITRTRRVPSARPKTAAAARAAASSADTGGALAALWAAEPPYEPDGRKIPGTETRHRCPECSGPMRWTGAHTGLLCGSCGQWEVSPGAGERAAEHRAAIDQTAGRKSARLADPEAARRDAETLAGERAALADDLEGLADDLDVSEFPRFNDRYAAARRSGIEAAGIIGHYSNRVAKADTLDQLHAVAEDVRRFTAEFAPFADAIAGLRASLTGHDPARTPAVYYSDPDDYADDDEDQGDEDQGEYGNGMEELRAAFTQMASSRWLPLAAPTAPPGTLPGVFCAWCQDQNRRVNGRFPAAVARIEAPSMVPAPVGVCHGHLAAARRQYGTALRTFDQQPDQQPPRHRPAPERSPGAVIVRRPARFPWRRTP